MKEALVIIAVIAVLAGIYSLQMAACFNCMGNLDAAQLAALID